MERRLSGQIWQETSPSSRLLAGEAIRLEGLRSHDNSVREYNHAIDLPSSMIVSDIEVTDVVDEPQSLRFLIVVGGGEMKYMPLLFARL